MNQDKKNVFLSHDHLWCSQTKRINHENQVAVLCIHTGFFTRSGAKKDYKETTRLFQKELAALKDSSHCPFLLKMCIRDSSTTWLKQRYPAVLPFLYKTG